MFNAVGQSLCDHALEGFNVTLFCYGQTGTGKTYTMQGPSSYSSSSDQHHNDYKDRGLVQRTIEYLLACQDTNSSNTTTGDHQHETNHRIEYLNKISSFVEIYNESIFDLLDPEAPQCQLREDLKKGGIYVHGATERVIETTQDAQQILEIGNRNRTTASTEMNRCSSRSHSILTLTIQTKVNTLLL